MSSVVILNVLILNVANNPCFPSGKRLYVIMLSVVAPFERTRKALKVFDILKNVCPDFEPKFKTCSVFGSVYSWVLLLGGWGDKEENLGEVFTTLYFLHSL